MFLFIIHFGFHWMNLSGQPQPPSLGITNPTYLHTNMPNYLFTSHPSLPYHLLSFHPFFPLFVQAHKRSLWREFKLVEKIQGTLFLSSPSLFSPFPSFFSFLYILLMQGIKLLVATFVVIAFFFYYLMELKVSLFLSSPSLSPSFLSLMAQTFMLIIFFS